MSGLLANSCFGFQEHTDSELRGKDRIAKGASFVVLDVTRFLPVDEFRRRVDELIADVHSSNLAPGVERIYVPGELEAHRRELRRREGIPLSVPLISELNEIAESLECPPLATSDHP
jgi:LDH2 family malate/lactate/ureidoglycolate dehydrogenase